jgi:hypothetical protein
VFWNGETGPTTRPEALQPDYKTARDYGRVVLQRASALGTFPIRTVRCARPRHTGLANNCAGMGSESKESIDLDDERTIAKVREPVW